MSYKKATEYWKIIGNQSKRIDRDLRSFPKCSEYQICSNIEMSLIWIFEKKASVATERIKNWWWNQINWKKMHKMLLLNGYPNDYLELNITAISTRYWSLQRRIIRKKTIMVTLRVIKAPNEPNGTTNSRFDINVWRKMLTRNVPMKTWWKNRRRIWNIIPEINQNEARY